MPVEVYAVLSVLPTVFFLSMFFDTTSLLDSIFDVERDCMFSLACLRLNATNKIDDYTICFISFYIIVGLEAIVYIKVQRFYVF